MLLRMVALIGCTVVALVGSGCGSGSSTEGADTAPASAPTTSPAPTEREIKQAALRRYLAQSRAANGFYQRGRSTSQRAQDAAAEVTEGDPRLQASGEQLREASAQVAEASVRQRIAEAPGPLKAINRAFARDMGEVADFYDELGGALRDDSVEAYNAVEVNAGGPVRNEWRLQVTAYCRQLGVELPEWAEGIGTRVS